MQRITLCLLGRGSVAHVSIDIAMAYGDSTNLNYTICIGGRLYFSRLKNPVNGRWSETWYTIKAKVN